MDPCHHGQSVELKGGHSKAKGQRKSVGPFLCLGRAKEPIAGAGIENIQKGLKDVGVLAPFTHRFGMDRVPQLRCTQGQNLRGALVRAGHIGMPVEATKRSHLFARCFDVGDQILVLDVEYLARENPVPMRHGF